MFQGETCPRDVPRGRDKNSVHIFGGQYTKNLGEQNTCKIRRDFGQLKSLTADISVTDRDIKKIDKASDQHEPSHAEGKKW